MSEPIPELPINNANATNYLKEIENAFSLTAGIPQVLIVYLIIFAIILIVYLSIRWRIPQVYWPKKYNNDTIERPTNNRKPFHMGWIKSSARIRRRDELKERIGLNGFLFVTFERYILIYVAICTVVAIVTLIPIHILLTDGILDDNIDTSFMRTTATLVPVDSPYFWVHFALTFLFSFGGLGMLALYQRTYLSMKQQLKKELPPDQARTLYIEGLDMDVRDRKLLFKFFQQMWPGKIVAVHLGWRGEKILAIINQKKEFEAHAALANDFVTHPDVPKYVKFFRVLLNPIIWKKRGEFFKLDKWQEQILNCESKIEKKRNKVLSRGKVDLCFVTFMEPVDADNFVREFFHAKKRKRLMHRIKDYYDTLYVRTMTMRSLSIKSDRSSLISSDVSNISLNIPPSPREDTPMKLSEEIGGSKSSGDETNEIEDLKDEISEKENTKNSGDHVIKLTSMMSDLQGPMTDEQIAEITRISPEDLAFEQTLESMELMKKIHVTKWRVKLAIDRPKSLLWSNLYSTATHRWVVNFFTNLLVITISLFWAIPVSVFVNITVIASTDDLAPHFGWILTLPEIIIEFIQTVIPVAMTSAFYLLLPMMLTAIAMLERPHSLSSLNRSVFHKYFIFAITNLVIFKAIFDTGTEIIRVFSNDLASENLEGFFLLFSNIDYSRVTSLIVGTLIRKTLFDTMIELTLLAFLLAFLFSKIRTKLTRVTQPHLHTFEPEGFHYDIQFGYVLISLSLALNFSLVSPITLIGGLFYMLFKILVTQHNLLFVHPRDSQISGKLISAVINNAFVTLVLFQLTMFFFLLVKQQDLTAFLLLMLPILTIFLAIVLKGLRYRKKREIIIRRNKHMIGYPKIGSMEEFEALKVAYLHPAFKGTDLEHDQSLDTGYLITH